MRSRALLFLLITPLLACEPAASTPPAAPSAPAAPPPAPTLPAASAAAPAPPPRHAPAAPVPIEEYFKVLRAGGLSLSHDEKLVAYMSDAGGRMDLWVKPLAGVAATQITHVKGFVHSFAFSPTADQLIYEADTSGDELPHLYLTNAKGESPRDLVADYPAGRRTQFIRWADDGKTFLFVSNLRDEKYMDLYEYDLKKGKAELLWQGSGKLSFALPSADHKRFIITETISDADSNMYLVERGKKDGALLTKHQGEVLYGPAAFSKDDKTLYFASDETGEFTSLYAMDLAKKTAAPVLKAEWDVDEAGVSRSGKYMYTVVNVDGTPKLTVEETAKHKEVALPAPPPGGAWRPVEFSPSERYLGAYLATDTAPEAPYVLDLKEGKATQVADLLPASLRGRGMVLGESVRVTSFDDRKVQAFVYRPTGKGPFPGIIDVHGGPTGQSRRDFRAMRQYLVSKGWVVMVPNVRGSTGYGKTYTKLDNLDLGGGPLKDVLACKKWLIKEANVDADKVVVMGGSYGGYMTLAAAAFTPTEFAAHVDYFGVSDLKSLVESFPPYWASGATYIYKKFGDPRNPEHQRYQHDRSPLNFADKIERPLLVVQGDHDARVKKDQSDRLVAAVTKRGVPVHYLVIADEGHGFSKKENILLASRATDRFLDRYVFGDTSIEVLPAAK